MKVLVTGGAGYVGSHCLRELVRSGHQALVYDNLSFGHRAAVLGQELIEADLADQRALRETFERFKPDAVMHFAAFLFVGESVSEPLKYYRNNVANTLNLLEVMRQAGCKRMVFSSTCATYGQPERMPITEDTSQRPINPYGRSKLVVEYMLQDSACAWGLSATALRYFNVAGASADGLIGEDHDPEIHLIPRVLMAVLGAIPHIEVFGEDYPTPDGTCIRDYIHVEDLAVAHRLALDAVGPTSGFQAYNVGTGHGTSVKEIITAAEQVTGQKVPLKIGPRRAGDPATLYADPAKIKRELGWQAKFTHTDSVATAWNFMQKHPKGFEE